MEVIVAPGKVAACEIAARRIADTVREYPAAVLGLATGGTMVRVYRELVRLHRNKGLDFGGVTTFNLDEYIGLEPQSPHSYHTFMREHLFDQIDIDRNNTNIPDGMSPDICGSCAAYEKAIADAGGIDLQVLGLGANGHIGFNEPGSPLDSRTRMAVLTDETARDNARFFDGDETRVPRECITMGVSSIFEAKKILLVAYGEKKAAVVAAAVKGTVSVRVPASVLQKHSSATVVLDEAAASTIYRQNIKPI